MKCPNCGTETNLKFCPKCHGLIREPFIEKDEKEDILKNGVGAYLKDNNHPIIIKNYSIPSLILGSFYTSYYKLYKTTILEMLLDILLVYYILSGYVPILLTPFIPYLYYFLIFLRFFIRATIGNTLMLMEIKNKVKKMVDEGDDLEMIAIKGGTSIILPSIVFVIYVFVFLIFL